MSEKQQIKTYPGVFVKQKAAFQNVVSRRERFLFRHMQDHLTTFLSDVAQENLSMKGPWFYTLNHPPKGLFVDIEFFCPVNENVYRGSDLRFSTYMEVGPLLCYRLTHDFYQAPKKIYAELLQTLEINKLKMTAPFFHLYPVGKPAYVDIMLPYAPDDEAA